MRGWRAAGAPREVLRWLAGGVPVRFAGGRPPRPFHFGGSEMDPAAAQWWAVEKERYLATGALERTKDRRYVSRAFVVPKPQGAGYRLVVDLRHLNRHCDPLPVRYDTLKRLRTVAQRGDWMVSFDLQDGYHHLAVRASDRRYFTFEMDGEAFRCAALPFGWSHSPAIFTRFASVMVKALRRRGVRVVPYLDDFLLLWRTEAGAAAGAQATQALLQELGLTWHPRKSHWAPTQRLVHLGLEVDTAEGVFSLTVARRHKVRAAAGALRVEAKAHARWVPARQLAQFIGLAISGQLAVPAARLHLRSLYDALATRTTWASRVRLTGAALHDLAFWQQVAKEGSAGPIWRAACTAVLHCDSSTYGWGGVLNGQMPVRGEWSPEEQLEHITLKELRAVRLTVQEFAPHLVGKRIRLHEDNQTVVAVWSALTSRSPALMAEIRLLWGLLASMGAELRAEYIPSAANVWADALSRVVDPGDYSLDPAAFQALDERWGPHTVDRFAAAHNALLPRYNALLGGAGCEAVDAFAQDWSGDNSFAHPPTPVLPQLAQFLRETGAAATVVAPAWPTAPWYQLLLAGASDVAFLPCRPGLLRLGRNPGARLPSCRRLVAFRFDGASR